MLIQNFKKIKLALIASAISTMGSIGVAFAYPVLTPLPMEVITIQFDGEKLNPKTDSLVWQYAAVKNLKNNEELTLTGQFIVYGKSKIEWIQHDGEETITFQISGITGNWVDAQLPGSITYAIKLDQSKGEITITRTASEMKIDFKLANPQRPDTSYRFYINSLEKLTR